MKVGAPSLDPSGTSATQPQHLKSLTAARYFAAVAVVFYHFGHKAVQDAPALLRNFVFAGFAGVGFFFLLSGFVLAYIYGPRVGRIKPSSFYFVRFARIYPVYFLSFLLAASPVLLNLNHHKLDSAGVKMIAYVAMVQAWLPWFGNELNGAAWTLSVEAAFYACFPFILPWFMRLNRRECLTGLAAFAGLSLIVPLIAVATGATPSTIGFDGNLLRFFPVVHLPTFICGIFTARLYEFDRAEGRYRRWVLPSGALALLVAIALFRGAIYYFIHDGALILPFAALIYGLAAREGICGKGPVPRVLVLLGDASYGIYILQFPIFAWITGLLSHVHRAWDVDHPMGLLGYAIVLSAICVLIYRYYESPVRGRLRSMVARRTPGLPSVAVTDIPTAS
jgi:peptidoglycan/LPS O-acetylase OafA/YrhL